MPFILPNPYSAIPGIEVHTIDTASDSPTNSNNNSPSLSVRIANSPIPKTTDPIERDWALQVSKNPRLYSGPLLAVISIDFDTGEFYCRRDEFKRLVVQPRVMTGVRLLAVCGVLLAPDERGRDHLLLGRRGEKTRIYPGQWETVPAGGVSPPAPNITMLDEHALKENLYEEMHEELGVSAEHGFEIGPPRALVRDHIAYSDDIAFEIRAPSLESARHHLAAAASQPHMRHNWEYSDTRWIALDEIAAFDAKHASEIIAPTRALFRVLGWM